MGYKIKVKVGLKLKSDMDFKAMLKWFQDSIEIEEVEISEEPEA